MNEELIDLFEINHNKTLPVNNVHVNVRKHVLIRLAVIVIVLIVFFTLLTTLQGWDGLMWVYASFWFVPLWAGYMLVETIVLFVQKKVQLRNANLIMLVVFLLFCLCVYLSMA